MPLHVLGINHHSAPLEVREKLAFPPETQADVLNSLAARPGVDEAVLVSTCNRTEVYCRAADLATVRDWLKEQASRSGLDIESHLYAHSEAEAVRHAFRVASGLDSMVLGEPQILGQVKQSVRTAGHSGTLGSTLNRLFQHTFSVAKEVRTQTAIGAQSISMSAAALKLAQNLFGDISRTKMLLIGVGEMVELAATYFVAQGPQSVVVANRTLARGEAFADRFSGTAIALEQLPEQARGPGLLVRADSGGATHAFLDHVAARGFRFSVGFDLTEPVRDAILALPEQGWRPALTQAGAEREGAAVAELVLDLEANGWPAGTRAICRRERPHPGAQLSFSDESGYRFQVFITNQQGRRIERLEQLHRHHALVEDRIRCGKDTGLRNLPFRRFAPNAAWLELALIAQDLLAWTQRLLLEGELARCEPKRLRYRLLHVAGRLTHHARRLRLHLPREWPWRDALLAAFQRLRALPQPP